MGLFGRGRNKTTVSFDDNEVRLSGRGEDRSVRWPELTSVSIETTSAGPRSEDLFFVLFGARGNELRIPQSAMPDDLLRRLQQLPEFSNDVLIEAMGSTSDRSFPLWTRPDLR